MTSCRCLDALESRTHLALTPGSLDPSFGTDGQLTDKGSVLAIQADGRMLASVTSANRSAMTIERWLSNGAADPTFAKTTIPITGADRVFSSRAAFQKDGKLIVAVNYQPSDAEGDLEIDIAVFRLNSTGGIDTAYGTAGQTHFSFGTGQDNDGVSSVTLQSDGKLLIAGNSTSEATDVDFAIARLTTAGKLDTAFRSTGKRTVDFNSRVDSAYTVLAKPNGKIILTGQSTGYKNEASIAQINADGSLDTSFSSDGKGNYGLFGPWKPAVLQPDGMIVIAGISGLGDLALLRVKENGAVDTSFGNAGTLKPGGALRHADVRAFLPTPEGRYVIVASQGLSGQSNWVALRFTPQFVRDEAFGDDGVSVIDFDGNDDFANSAAVAPDGSIMITGSSDASVIAARLMGDIGPFGQPIIAPNGTLRVTGGEGKDRLLLGVSGANVNVTINGVAKSFPLLSVKRVEVYGFAGNDRISAALPIPTLLEGSTGDDTLIGGNGDDVLIGGRGNDRLNGGNGRDILSAGAGNDKLFADDGAIDTLSGSEGIDVAGLDLADVSSGIETILA